MLDAEWNDCKLTPPTTSFSSVLSVIVNFEDRKWLCNGYTNRASRPHLGTKLKKCRALSLAGLSGSCFEFPAKGQITRLFTGSPGKFTGAGHGTMDPIPRLRRHRNRRKRILLNAPMLQISPNFSFTRKFHLR